jgi:paraquat-inducible protein B
MDASAQTNATAWFVGAGINTITSQGRAAMLYDDIIKESRAQREEILQLRQELGRLRAENTKQLDEAHKVLAEAQEALRLAREAKERAGNP